MSDYVVCSSCGEPLAVGEGYQDPESGIWKCHTCKMAEEKEKK